MSESLRILTINSGSSSLKAGLYGWDGGDSPRRLAAVEAARIGQSTSELRIDGTPPSVREISLPDHAAALRTVLDALVPAREYDLVCHRIVHGGRYSSPQVATNEVVGEVRRFVPLAPDHLPQALAALEVLRREQARAVQLLCFDTAFHASMPDLARTYALPQRFRDAGIQRYGFHGLSCEFVLGALRATDPDAALGRIIVAHLGSGASMTAIAGGASVDTTMGLSPLGGLVMSSRSGDLDPGVVLQLLRTGPSDADALTRILGTESGLVGISGTTGDMEDLLARESTDDRAARAVALFCYAARQAIGRLVATLGGLDTLVFTGGIGEHAPGIRARIVDPLGCFGLALDPASNGDGAPIVSTAGSRVVIRVMQTDEDAVLAGHACAFLTRTKP